MTCKKPILNKEILLLLLLSAQTSARHTVITPEVLTFCKYKIHILVYKAHVCKTQANIKILKLYKITYQNKYGHKMYLWLKVDSL